MLSIWVSAVFSPYGGAAISPYFFYFLTNWSVTLMTILCTLACFNDDKFSHTSFSVSALLFVAWILFLVPFDPHVLSGFHSYVSHLFPLLLQLPPFLPLRSCEVLSPPPQPPFEVLHGLTFYLIYILWTVVFSLFNLTCEGRTYIYKSLSWSRFPLLSLVIVLTLLLFYAAVYFAARRVLLKGCDPHASSPRMTSIPSPEEDRTEGVLKLRTSSNGSGEEDDDGRPSVFQVV
ncbi:hypothetical protein TrRE_jg13334 [Triparma retinervis]|uniref:Uncharacterized protein n=1 Tax=Triparma retinervis TaxID=2557542 RepID=A0A9W7L3M9_9STRA|nr:hypothetical protein TrRE_jg13334 [Triparma retinervis]